MDSPPAALPEQAVAVRVWGTVQGVGFRPWVYQQARALALRGDVYNDGAGVSIRLAGTTAAIAQFRHQLQTEPPPLARVDGAEVTEIPPATVPPGPFTIAPSHGGPIHTHIAPDTATCPQCLADIWNPASRFYRYPFTNCTHCGPRLSLIQALPYDRPQTAMAGFPLCPDCQRQYENPGDRRFHAQPIACPRCGPQVTLVQLDDADPTLPAEPIAAVQTLLKRGEIVAIKGLGGFHLACDATNAAAIQRLRHRKHRPHKPLALMVKDVAAIAHYCYVSDGERSLLCAPAAPIVLLQRRLEEEECVGVACPQGLGGWVDGWMGQGVGEWGSKGVEDSEDSPELIPITQSPNHPITQSLPYSLAPNLPTLGVMLPYTPLHHLIMAGMDRPIVLTSGNRVGEPQCIDNEQALATLGDISRYLLLHDRPIVNRVDDSVVRVVAGQRQTLRRARGYAPAPIALPKGFEAAPPILAMGGELKSTICLVQDGQAILSQHLGDLEQAAAWTAYQETVHRYLTLFDHQPTAIAVDRHPDYLASKWGRQLATEWNQPVYEVQHHHAHIAACLVEHGHPLDGPPVLGIVLDGLGYGADDTLWGGEFLLADYRDFQRLGHLEAIALLGGAQAMKQPWRNTYAHLVTALGWDTLMADFSDVPLVQFLARQPRGLLDQMLATGLRSPRASSAGRLWDAVAAAVGCCPETVSYEGQGAIALEALVTAGGSEAGYPFRVLREMGSGGWGRWGAGEQARGSDAEYPLSSRTLRQQSAAGLASGAATQPDVLSAEADVAGVAARLAGGGWPRRHFRPVPLWVCRRDRPTRPTDDPDPRSAPSGAVRRRLPKCRVAESRPRSPPSCRPHRPHPPPHSPQRRRYCPWSKRDRSRPFFGECAGMRV
jgi:hydrogenase maturation protein HypF